MNAWRQFPPDVSILNNTRRGCVEICTGPAGTTAVFSCGISAVLLMWKAMAESAKIHDRPVRLRRLPLL
jgi:hypothetical protein